MVKVFISWISFELIWSAQICKTFLIDRAYTVLLNSHVTTPNIINSGVEQKQMETYILSLDSRLSQNKTLHENKKHEELRVCEKVQYKSRTFKILSQLRCTSFNMAGRWLQTEPARICLHYFRSVSEPKSQSSWHYRQRWQRFLAIMSLLCHTVNDIRHHFGTH